MKKPKGNLPLSLSLLPELDVRLLSLMSPSVSREWELLLLLLLLGMGETGAEGAGDGSAEGFRRELGAFPSMSRVQCWKKDSLAPGGQDFTFLVCLELPP